MTTQNGSFLATRRGGLTLLLLAAAGIGLRATNTRGEPTAPPMTSTWATSGFPHPN